MAAALFPWSSQSDVRLTFRGSIVFAWEEEDDEDDDEDAQFLGWVMKDSRGRGLDDGIGRLLLLFLLQLLLLLLQLSLLLQLLLLLLLLLLLFPKQRSVSTQYGTTALVDVMGVALDWTDDLGFDFERLRRSSLLSPVPLIF